MLTTANARCRHHSHVGTARSLQRCAQRLRPSHLTGQRLADAHGQLGRYLIAFLDDVEVVIKRGDLVHLGHGQAHLVRKRDNVRRRDTTVGILDAMQEFDEQVAPSRRIAKQCLHLG